MEGNLNYLEIDKSERKGNSSNQIEKYVKVHITYVIWRKTNISWPLKKKILYYLLK